MTVHTLTAENWKMDGGVAFGVVPQSIWKKSIEPDEYNLIPITTRCLLVQEGNRKILFDTGMGRKQSEKFYGFRHLFGEENLGSSLKAIGLSESDITDVVFTHLHDDHCGGAMRPGADGNPEPVFPNADYHCSAAQWDWARNPNKREAGSYFPVNLDPLQESGRLHLIREPGPFSENIDLRFMHGHTAGLIVPLVRAGNKTLVFPSDLVPLAANIPLPYIASVDIQPLVAMKEKEQFLEEAVEEGYFLVFQHDYHIECCSLEHTDKGVRMAKDFSLKEILT